MFNEIHIVILTNISDFIKPCILKYLLRAQQLADLLLHKALRPMKEGLGS